MFHPEFVLVKFYFCTEVLYTSWIEKLFSSALGVFAEKWDLFYFHLSQPKLDLYSFCTLFSCTYGIVLWVLNCNFIQRNAFKIWCHNSICGCSVSGVTLPCYVELMSYNVLELKFFGDWNYLRRNCDMISSQILFKYKKFNKIESQIFAWTSCILVVKLQIKS